MSPWREFKLGFRNLFRRDAVERELDDELEHFIALATQDNIRNGMTPDAALRAARADVGSVAAVKERATTIGWERGVETVVQDIRYAVRALRRNPGFATVAIATLALGIGANTAMFSVVRGLMFRPLPYAEPQQLAMVWTDDVARGLHEEGTSFQTLQDWRNKSRNFADFAYWYRNTVVVRGDGEPERARAAFVSTNFLSLLGVQPVLGSALPADSGGERVALISYGLWQRRFGGSRNAIGATITLGGDATSFKAEPRSVRIVGVLPAGFDFPSKDTQVWEPISTYWRWPREAGDRFYSALSVIGRLAPGGTIAGARAELSGIGGQLTAAYPHPPRDFPGFVARVVPLRDQLVGSRLQTALWMLLATVGLVLLIACVNVANLMLARGSVRTREMAVRTALGAGRARVFRQLFTESVVLGVVAGVVGLALAAAVVPLLVSLAPADVPRLDQIRIDGTVLMYTGAASLMAALVFGLAPAWSASDSRPGDAMKQSTRSSGGLRLVRARGLMVVTEFALALILLAGAGLLLRSLDRLRHVDPGFDPNNVLLARVDMGSTASRTIRQDSAWLMEESRTHDMLGHLRQIPGVEGVALVGGLFMSGGDANETLFAVDGEPVAGGDGSASQLASTVVSEEFFTTMRVPILAGRALSRDDLPAKTQLFFPRNFPRRTVTAEPVVVNETFVRRFLGGRGAVGRRFTVGSSAKPWVCEVVGVVADMRQQGLQSATVPEYFALSFGVSGQVIIRTRDNPLQLLAAIRQTLRADDPQAMLTDATTIESYLGSLSAQRRFQTTLLAVFAAIALVLAGIGIYGVMRYTVEQQSREIGIRLALGATARDVQRAIVGRGMMLTLAGIAAGLVGALALNRFLRTLLFEITPTDAWTYASAVLALSLVSFLACYLPARRVMQVDPIAVLRQD